MTTTTVDHASAGTITITLTSLPDGSYRQSAAINNDTNGYIDAHVGGSIQVGTSPTAAGTIEIYAYGSYDNTNYTAGCSGSDAAYTADGEEDLLKLIEVITVDATSDQDYVWGPVPVAEKHFGGFLPVQWGIVVLNNTGAALNATGTNNEVQFIGLTLNNA
jgi:hypothetical protein